MTMTKITPQLLQFWIKNEYNVLMKGKHGVGKTALISKAFTEAFGKINEGWVYFSGSTMDPFIDLVGVPIKIEGPDGEPYIELIRPRRIASGKIRGVVIDEYNRSHKRVRNALMEMIQFGTINGIPLNKDGIRPLVWVAVNPDSDSNSDLSVYDTDRIDPAQLDRFQVQVELPYDCDDDFFADTFKEQGVAAVEFWRNLPAAEKEKVSPRRLEYAIRMFQQDADLRHCLEMSVNPGRLAQILSVGSASKKLKELFGNEDESRRFLSNDNNYVYALGSILSTEAYKSFFLPLLSPEKISLLFVDNKDVREWMLGDIRKNKLLSRFSAPLLEVATASVNLRRAKEIREELERAGVHASPSQIPIVYARPLQDPLELAANEAQLEEMTQAKSTDTKHRKKLWNQLSKSIPENMTAKAAHHVLTICNICCDSTAATIDAHMPNMVKVSNYAISVLLKGGYTVDQVKKIMSESPRVSKYRLRQAAPTVQDIANFIDNQKKNKGEGKAAAKLLQETA